MPVTWEEPGKPGAGRPPGPVRWAVEAAQLKARPGTWGAIGSAPLDGSACELSRLRSSVRRIHTGSFRAFRPAGSFEAATRKVPGEGQLKLFARYVGTTRRQEGRPPVQVGEDGTVLAVTPRAALPGATARKKLPPPRRAPATPSRPDTPQVRQWARLRGLEVSSYGRLARSLYSAYDQAMAAAWPGERQEGSDAPAAGGEQDR